ncbi:MAG: hypothetical protein HPM95_00735 [Alphaproteobacteria bacterium]|nr:hypothetical protein [Alphaproteobacteria bacterium]
MISLVDCIALSGLSEEKSARSPNMNMSAKRSPAGWRNICRRTSPARADARHDHRRHSERTGARRRRPCARTPARAAPLPAHAPGCPPGRAPWSAVF